MPALFVGIHMPAFAIRTFEPRDREAVVQLQWALNRHEETVSGDRALGREAAEACLRDDEEKMAEHGGIALVAEAGGEVAGYLCCVVIEGGPFVRADLRWGGYVTTMVVGEPHRGQGIAGKLLDEAERFTRERGLSSLGVGVLPGNAAAERLYERFGFRPYAIEMVKRL